MFKLGVDPAILRAWSGALCGLSRRFKVRSSTGPSVKSVTGFPEGCALSVTAMLGLNFLCHAFCNQLQPRCTLWSYVDNLEITSPTPDGVISGMTGLRRFWTLLEVDIDPKKSYCWSVASQARQQLRQSDWPIRLWARDLGGHIQYSLQRTNSTITKKCEAIKPLWNRLARSLAPYYQKLRSLRTKAWPNCLHGCQSVHLADDHFQHLRTGALRALGEHSPGMSPAMHLSLVEHPMHDPQCFVLIHTAFLMRDMQPTVADFEFAMQVHHEVTDSVLPKPGPFSVLLVRLQQIAWTWNSQSIFLDQHGVPCDILSCPVQELKVRLSQGWQARILAQHAGRKTMQGLTAMHPQLTTEQLQAWPAEDQALLRTCLNGTFFTADRRKHQGEGHDTNCRFCGEPDSQWHRHWTCPWFSGCRHIPPEHTDALQHMPLALTCHGWMPEPPALLPFRRACVDLYVQPSELQLPPSLPEHLHLFTDGTCRHPQCGVTRLAAWGVALGRLDHDDFWPVGNGFLVGWVHTILRAELWAVIQACSFALQVGKPCTLWIDNDLVFRRIRSFRNKPCWIRPNQKDADLWSFVYRLVQQLGSSLVAVVKVYSHQDHDSAVDNVESWVFQGNDAADALAEQSFDDRSPLYRLWYRLTTQVAEIRTLRQSLHATLVQVGRLAVKGGAPPQTAAPNPRAPRLTMADVEPVVLVPLAETTIPDRFWFAGCGRILRWVQQLDDPDHERRLLSWFQLNALCEADLNTRGVKYHLRNRQWSSADGLPIEDFARRTNLLARYVKSVTEAAGGKMKPAHVRPDSGVLQFWTQCLAIRLPFQRWHKAEALLRDQQAQLSSVREVRGLL